MRGSELKVALSLFAARTDGAIDGPEDVALGRLHRMNDAILGAQSSTYRARRDRALHGALDMSDGMQPGEQTAKGAHGAYPRGPVISAPKGQPFSPRIPRA